MENCVFCKIINKEIPADIIFEDEKVIAFNDKNPITPVHVLIIPKKHIPTIDDLEEKEEVLAGRLILTAQKIARNLNISEKGYKLLFRVKEYGGQEIDHIHLHLLGGAKLTENIRPIINS
ncbi:MAG: histidine triad nucleotide-binding protein [Candidatus Marinimicrobia bacterium]|nr:histidine triad nucleotide-binding protein [Candidatus Neomarinimicrobiota bacterium]